MKVKLMPYKRYSKSSSVLRRVFGYRSGLPVVHPDKTPVGTGLVINWGSTKEKPNARCTWLNKPENVKVAVNKLMAFEKLKAAGVNVPDFSTDVAKAREWIGKEYKVLARFKLASHSGNGIKVVSSLEELPSNAPLYVRYYRKKSEFRVHVFNGEIIDLIEKRARQDKPENFNQYIRSYDNGWVFCRDDIEDIPKVKEEAIKAVQALGLDFGAVDVIWTKNEKAIVLEVNCAPAMEGTTVEKYARAIEQYVR